jgi:hypothetical protein
MQQRPRTSVATNAKGGHGSDHIYTVSYTRRSQTARLSEEIVTEDFPMRARSGGGHRTQKLEAGAFAPRYTPGSFFLSGAREHPTTRSLLDELM